MPKTDTSASSAIPIQDGFVVDKTFQLDACQMRSIVSQNMAQDYIVWAIYTLICDCYTMVGFIS